MSEVLRETLHLKKEEGAIEVRLKAHNKAYVFHPQHVDDTFDAIVRSRQQHASARALRDEQGESHPHARAEAGFTADPHAAHTAPDSAQLQALLEKATLERTSRATRSSPPTRGRARCSTSPRGASPSRWASRRRATSIP